MSKYRVMIIDDDDDARRMLAMALRGRYEVVEASDGLDALSKLETHEPDFAIIDIMMPLMDGYQVCESIRRHPRFKTMQVMFLSAFGSKENIKKSYAVGANLFMTKPVDPDRVLKNIDFTIQHEPPPLRYKKYSVEQLEKLEPAVPAPAPDAPHAAAPAAGPPRMAPAEVHEPSVGAPEPVPAAPRPTAAPTPRPSTGQASPAGRVRVLVVDDDPEMLQMVELAIRDDYEVTTACNGLEAIEHMVDYEPDLMLMDIMMPKMNGYQLLQSIRRNAFFKNLPVIVISAKSTPRDREYAARLGATDFIAKPYHIEELLAGMAKVAGAAGFAVRPKSMTLDEINNRADKDMREKQERAQEIQRKRVAGQALDSLLDSEGHHGHRE